MLQKIIIQYQQKNHGGSFGSNAKSNPNLLLFVYLQESPIAYNHKHNDRGHSLKPVNKKTGTKAGLKKLRTLVNNH